MVDRLLTGLPRIALAAALWIGIVAAASVGGAAAEVRQISLRTSDIVFDRVSQRIYASVPGNPGAPGTVTVIDPVTGAIGPSIPIGIAPGKLALSDDGQFLYVALDGSAAVRRFHIPTLTAELEFPLGRDPFFGSMFVEDMAVLPGRSRSIAVSRMFSGVSPRHAGVAIYDDGRPRPVVTATPTVSNVIAFSATEGRLYGLNVETTEFGFQRMSVDAAGVSLVGDVAGNLLSGFGADIVFDGGRIYSTTGRVIDPEALTLVGTYPGVSFGALVRPDSTMGRTYVLNTGVPTTSTLSAFNQSTFTLIGTLTVPGVSGTPGSLIQWGPERFAFRTDAGQIFLVSATFVPGPGGGPGPVVPVPGVDEVKQISLATNDLVFDPVRRKIYASVPGSAGALGNTITVLDPFTGAVGPSIPIGSEPGRLALSDDGSVLYVALDGAAAVRRLDLASLTPGLQFPLGRDPFFGSLSVDDMAVLPGRSRSIAVSRMFSGVSPRHAGVAIYDDGIPRPVVTPTHTGSNVIAFSATAERLYGLNVETTEFGFRRMSVDATGVSVVDVTEDLLSGFVTDIVFEGGRIYSTTGRVIDPEARSLVGTFPDIAFGGLVRPDSRFTYFLTKDPFAPTGGVLSVFNQATFTLIATLSIPELSESPSSLIRWGPDGLAFGTRTGQLFLVRTSLVPCVSATCGLKVTKAGTGTGTVSSVPAGIDCGGMCSGNFANGSSVTLSAQPGGSAVFAGWSGGPCVGTGPCTVTVTAARITVTATFNAIGGPPAPAPAGPREIFVARFYREVLGRDPDSLGLVAWAEYLRVNCHAGGLNGLASGFFDSLEFRFARRLSLPGLVRVLYRAFLGRDPEPAGLTAWAAVFRGIRLGIAEEGFIPSPEFQALLPDRTNRAAVTEIVRRFYAEMLGRAPEPTGLAAWVDYVVGTEDLEGAATAFLASREFEGKALTSRDHVTILYRTFLGRDPEPAGLDAWEEIYRFVLLRIINRGFVPSQEFQSLLPPLCR